MGAVHVLEVAGELDADTSPFLAAVVEAALTPDCRLLVLDIARIDFCDSSGLNRLLDARTNTHHTPLVLAAPAPRLLRLLDITGARQVFEIADSVQTPSTTTPPPATTGPPDRHPDRLSGTRL
nr:STAS domain-containing protein [Kitasatospora sp. SolWspMP-SS2h]